METPVSKLACSEQKAPMHFRFARRTVRTSCYFPGLRVRARFSASQAVTHARAVVQRIIVGYYSPVCPRGLEQVPRCYA